MISLNISHNIQVSNSVQLPVTWYTDPTIYALEVKHLFPQSTTVSWSRAHGAKSRGFLHAGLDARRQSLGTQPARH